MHKSLLGDTLFRPYERVSKGQYNMDLGMLWNPDGYYAIFHYTIVIKG